MRERLPDTRNSVTHKFTIDGIQSYITVGTYPDGRPGEIFFRAGDGLHEKHPGMEPALEMWCIAVSILLQDGKWDTVVDKFAHQRFEPRGLTDNKDIPIAKSIVDYITRWMVIQFTGKECDGIRKATIEGTGGDTEEGGHHTEDD
jgi:ribonucleoside-diphosphate reductase alpha chain